MYPLSSFGHALLSLIVLAITIGLIIRAIQRPLLALKIVTMISVPVISSWITTYALIQVLRYFEGDKDAQIVVALLGGLIMFFACSSFMIKILKVKDE
ncbi:TPA: hypothetical protein R5E59_002833 [Enterobacter cloacae]|jgi:hypothetical protein|nr:hypothetical protein [Enterobacter cloacae]HBQ3901998.1 hypothetical protein [Klebsiella pneumoniae]HED5644626.1 hypothetical protein [Enterobacter cloacae]